MAITWNLDRLEEGDATHIYGVPSGRVIQYAYTYGIRTGRKFSSRTKQDAKGRTFIELTRVNLSGAEREPNPPALIDPSGEIRRERERETYALEQARIAAELEDWRRTQA